MLGTFCASAWTIKIRLFRYRQRGFLAFYFLLVVVWCGCFLRCSVLLSLFYKFFIFELWLFLFCFCFVFVIGHRLHLKRVICMAMLIFLGIWSVSLLMQYLWYIIVWYERAYFYLFWVWGLEFVFVGNGGIFCACRFGERVYSFDRDRLSLAFYNWYKTLLFGRKNIYVLLILFLTF